MRNMMISLISLSQPERELILEQHEIMHKFSRILLKRINAGK
jgi:hypothetical protein